MSLLIENKGHTLYTIGIGGYHMNKKIDVIISDLDGTLLNAQHTLSEFTKKSGFRYTYEMGLMI
jgi:hypothetical protein